LPRWLSRSALTIWRSGGGHRAREQRSLAVQMMPAMLAIFGGTPEIQKEIIARGLGL
jgi:hypothetical protein